MTTVSNRQVPDGYTEEWNSTTWNVGFVFVWSEVYEAWMDACVMITVKPGQALREAFEARMGEPMWRDYTVFFSLNH